MIMKIKELTDKINILVLDLESENRNLRKENTSLKQQIKEQQRNEGTPLVELKLSRRAINCLGWRDIKTIEELTKLSFNDLRRTRNAGKIILKEINDKVKAFGLTGWF